MSSLASPLQNPKEGEGGVARIRGWCLAHAKLLLAVIFSLFALSLAFGIGYLLGSEANQAPIIIETRGV